MSLLLFPVLPLFARRPSLSRPALRRGRGERPTLRLRGGERLEPRQMMFADPLFIGGTYLESDSGQDIHGPDIFEITFRGGAPGTQLTRVVIDVDQDGIPGVGNGDLFFDTIQQDPNDPNHLGRGAAWPFEVVEKIGEFTITSVFVEDGGTILIIDLEGFDAGEKLTFSIDVDEANRLDFRPGNPNAGVDEIASGNEFQGSRLEGTFIAPHFHEAHVVSVFVDQYDFDEEAAADLHRLDPTIPFTGTHLDLPEDNFEGRANRSAAAVGVLLQAPLPIAISGVVFHDRNLNLVRETGEEGIAGVTLALWKQNESGVYEPARNQQGQAIVTTTDAQGAYRFGEGLGLTPGVYQVRETQPADFPISVGAIPGLLDGVSVGVAATTNRLTGIAIPVGGVEVVHNDFAEARYAQLCGFVYHDRNHNGLREADEAPIAGVRLALVNAAGQEVAFTVTDAAGAYCFHDIVPGVYTVVQTQPPGWIDGLDAPGTIDGVTVGLLVGADAIGGIVLRSEEHGVDYNFGERLGSISGVVHADLNGDCTWQPGEPLLAGVTITLRNDDGQEWVTTTDDQGLYRFDSLGPGVYTVIQTQPDGYFHNSQKVGTGGGDNSVANVVSGIVLGAAAGDIDLTGYDFCEGLGSLSGFVYYDRNDNGRREPGQGEYGIAGVVIELRDAAGQPVLDAGGEPLTAVTNASGFYKFENLAPGVYRLVQRHPTGWIDGRDTPGTIDGVRVGQATNPGDAIGGIALLQTDPTQPGRHGVNYNFGERLGSITGIVHVDQNGNCTWDEGETLLAGVIVTLTDEQGNSYTTTTDAEGRYRFDELPAGVYTLRQTQPGGYFHNSQKAGSAGGDDSQPNVISDIQLSGGEHVHLTDYNFCEGLGQLSGFVYHDRNNNGVREPGQGEEGIAGVRLRLLDAAGQPVRDAQGQPLVAVTRASGYYEFVDLAPGVYRIVEEHPTGWIDGLDTPGTINGVRVGQATNPGDAIGGIALVQPDLTQRTAVGQNYNFGERLGSISGVVHVDLNGDCTWQPGEPLLAGVTITLRGDDGQEWVTTTDDQGLYRFDALGPGVYTVVQTQPDGYFHNTQKVGAGGGDNSVANVVSGIVLGAAAGDIHLTGYDFCEGLGSLSGFVYHDRNDNGLREAGEEGIAGVTIRLVDAAGQQWTTTTDLTGFYRFDDLAPGVYRLFETQPAGWLDGKDTPGTIDGVRSGRSSEPDRLLDIRLLQTNLGQPGRHGVEYNFGELRPGSIAGVVFVDPNLNLTPDPHETRLAGVTVELLNGQGTVIASTLTDSQGRYQFTDLQPGAYAVREIQPAGYFQGGQRAGSHGGDDSQEDLIAAIAIGSGQHLVDYNFAELPAATLSGYVFQDGPPLFTLNGEAPDNLRELRDGAFTPDDTPIAGVVLELRNGLDGSPVLGSDALPGRYGAGPIRAITNANGYYEFTGLPQGNYAVYQVHPAGYVDGVDTPGTTNGIAFNPGDSVPQFLLQSHSLAPRTDAIVLIPLAFGAHSQFNNFSEVRIESLPPPPIDRPPVDMPPPPAPPVLVAPPIVPPPPVFIPPPAPIATYGGGGLMFTWHLSIVDAGRPRGPGVAFADDHPLWRSVTHVHVDRWSQAALREAEWILFGADEHGAYVRGKQEEVRIFGIHGGIPLTGDWNGDGKDDLAIFYQGEWFLDLNGDGVWNEGDLWCRLGTDVDRPIVGDWNGDGKDDIGIFGPEWPNDPRAIEVEPGLPDALNLPKPRAKNVPRDPEDTPDGERLIRLGPAQNPTRALRADLVDHVFRFGQGDDVPVAGDWNGDGIRTIGIFRDGRWRLDFDGDGRWSAADRVLYFGQKGDIPVVGDWNGNGIESIGVYRDGQWILDTNNNGEIDQADKRFFLGGPEYLPVVGDWNGDGVSQPGLYRELPAGEPAASEAAATSETATGGGESSSGAE